MTLTSEVRDTPSGADDPGDSAATGTNGAPTVAFPAQAPGEKPVEFWSTSAIRAALENDDLAVWQRIVVAIKRDPELITSGADLPTSGSREFVIAPGMVWDNLAPGESVEPIVASRPNPALEPFVNGQVRRIAAGTGASYSSISRNYDGTYSSQRQEMVESWGAYATLQNEFIAQFVMPVWRRFVALALAAGKLGRLPRGIDLLRLDDADYRGPVMPWIDPVKEVEGAERRIAERGLVDQREAAPGVLAQLLEGGALAVSGSWADPKVEKLQQQAAAPPLQALALLKPRRLPHRFWYDDLECRR